MMLVMLPTLIGLGAWQWRRLSEKTDLIALIEQRAHAAPLPTTLARLLSPGASVASLDYLPVRLSGRFVPGTEAAVFTNRAEPPAGKPGGPGYDILMLFAAESGGAVLVNRGFVPPERRDAASRPAPSGTVEITGLIRRPERRSWVDGADAPEKNVFAIRDPATILVARLDDRRRAALQPVVDTVYIDLRRPVPDGGLPDPNETDINLPNNHLQYALTWWGLALVFCGMFALFLRGRTITA